MDFINYTLIRKFSFLITVFLLFIVITACRQNVIDDSSSTVIRGNFQGADGSKIYFLSCKDTLDLFQGKKSIIDSSNIDSDGAYELKPDVKSSCAFDLIYGKKKLVSNLFISPGDKIEMDFKGTSNTPVIKKSGPEAKYNNYLLQFLDSFYKDPVLKPQYYIASNYMDVDQFETYTNRRREQQISFFKSFFKGDSLKKEFADYALNTIEYGIAVDRLLYLWKKRMKVHAVSPKPSYYYFEDSTFLERSNAVSCPAYVHFLNLFILESYERRLESGEINIGKPGQLNPQVEKYKLAKKLLRAPYCNIVFVNIIINDMNSFAAGDTTIPTASSSFGELNAWFTNKYSLQ